MNKMYTFIVLLLISHPVSFSGNATSRPGATVQKNFPTAEQLAPTITPEDAPAAEQPEQSQHIEIPISTSAAAAQHPGAPTVVVHVHNENRPSFENSNNNDNSNTNVNYIYAHAQAAAQATAKATSKLYAKFRTRIDPHIELAKQTDFVALFQNNKKTLFWSALATIYSALSIQLISDRHYLNQANLWANWKRHMTAQEMQTSPQQELQKSLIEEILKRYLASHPNRLACYLQFVKDVEQEEKRIARHLLISKIVKMSRLMRIFPVSDQTMKQARVKQKRLAFTKHIFVSWAAMQPSLKGGLHEEIVPRTLRSSIPDMQSMYNNLIYGIARRL